jgi:hypothetical protein
LRRLLAATGWHHNIKNTSLSGSVEQLEAQGSLPRYVSTSAKLFDAVRNKIIHGGTATDDDILRAIDSGFQLLKAIESIPLARNIVLRVNVPIYSDSGCTQAINDGMGIILETISPDGDEKSYRIFPTTRTHFQIGKQVAWEWNLAKVWGAAWYRDANTGEIKQAWVASSEFIGRHLDDV